MNSVVTFESGATWPIYCVWVQVDTPNGPRMVLDWFGDERDEAESMRAEYGLRGRNARVQTIYATAPACKEDQP